MTDTRKLLDDSPDEVTRRLLRSALDDQPSARAFSRTAVALGVSGLVPIATTGAAAASATGSAATGTASTTVKLFGLVGFKWFGLGAILGLIVAGGASQVMGEKHPPTVIATPRATATGGRDAPLGMAAPALANPSPQATTAASIAPKRARTADSVGAADQASERALSAKTPTISREIAALDQARAALKRNDPEAALSAVDSLEREGAVALGPEATVIRVEALLARGETAKATALARRFMAENPSTPHANRMREVIRNQK